MTQATAKNSILAKLKLTKTQKKQAIDKTEHRRNNLLKKLDEQLLVAQATLNNEIYYSTKQIKTTDEDGKAVITTAQKRVNKWFFEQNNEWYLELRYSNRVLKMTGNCTAIAIGSKLENIIEIIATIKQAVEAKELDKAIIEVLTTKNKVVA